MREKNTYTQSTDLEIADLINSLWRKWYWFVAFILIGVLVAYTYNKTLKKLTQVQSVVLIDSGDQHVLRENQVPGLDLTNRTKRIENEMAILASKDIMEQAVAETNAFITCFEGHETLHEIFIDQLPVDIECSISDSTITSVHPLYFTDLGNNRFRIEFGPDESRNSIDANYNEELFIDDSRIVFSQNPNAAYWQRGSDDLQFTIFLNPFSNMVNSFRRKLEVFETSRNSDGIMLRMVETVPQRGLALQNAIISKYLLGMDEQRKEMAENAFSFIENRLEVNHGDLDSLERIIEDYRTSRDMVLPEKQIEFLYEGIKDFKTELSDAQTQLDIVDELINSIESDDVEISVPNTVAGVRDPLLNALVLRLAEKETEREEMRETVHQNNPLFKQLNNQINELKTSLNDDLRNFQRNMRITVADIEARIAEYEMQILRLSGNNREMDGFERKRNIMEELYNFLLKRREEAALVAQAELIDTWVIEKPHVQAQYFKPKKSVVLIIGLLIGWLIPATFFGYRFLFNQRIASVDEIKNNTELPVLGQLSRIGGNAFLHDTSASELNGQIEELKTLYFNLKFANDSAKKVLFSSAMANEGKTHLALNFASTLARMGKKTCLLEVDLRRPCIASRLGISDEQGLMNVLEGSASLDQVIRGTGISTDLQVITAGSSDDDPLRLLMSPRFNEVLTALESEFDFIILDAPPAMISADVMLLSGQSDINLFVVRQDVTSMKEVSDLEELHESGRICNMALVFNAARSKNKAISYYNKAG